MALDAHSLAADFASLLEADDDHILLAEAALTIARIEYPGLAFAPYLATLNDLAARPIPLAPCRRDARRYRRPQYGTF